jgi:hypothetical protein
VSRTWTIPEGLRVLPDGSWRVGELPVVHDRGLFYLKSHLVFEDDGAFVVDGPRRVQVQVQGPAFEVIRLEIDAARGTAAAVLDDGTVEPVTEGSLGMDEGSGRFECSVRGGRARARLTRGAHQTLLANAEEQEGRFALRAGVALIPIRT